MIPPPPSLDELRAAVTAALGDDRVATAAAGHRLVDSGLISSFELIVIALALEEHFRIRIDDASVTIANFNTLDAMQGLVAAKQGTAGGSLGAARGYLLPFGAQRLARVLRRPVALILLLGLFIVAADLALAGIMSGPLHSAYRAFMEEGQRLYPVSGGYSQDDLAFAVSQHRILAEAEDGNLHIAFFGDSGTIGSWVEPDEAIPAFTEAALRDRLPHARVFNLAFFMQFFAKDVMILEAVLEQSQDRPPFEVAVFTLDDAYFFRDFIDRLPSQMPYLSLNHGLLRNFAARLPEENRSPFLELANDLRSASSLNSSRLKDWLRTNSALYHYAPFFRQFVDELPGIDLLNGNYDFANQYLIGRRSSFDPLPPEPPAGSFGMALPDDQVDRRLIAVVSATIGFLHQHGVKVVLYLKPHGPNEWRAKYEKSGRDLTREVASQLCQGGRCAVVDARWRLPGRQFTDSVAHYTPDANRYVGGLVADALADLLEQ